jgi:hypothetical protein
MEKIKSKQIIKIFELLKESIENHKLALENKDFKLTEQYLGEKNAYWKVLNEFGFMDSCIKFIIEK